MGCGSGFILYNIITTSRSLGLLILGCFSLKKTVCSPSQVCFSNQMWAGAVTRANYRADPPHSICFHQTLTAISVRCVNWGGVCVCVCEGGEGGRWDWKWWKGVCSQRMGLRLPAHPTGICFAGLIVMPACVICPHLSADFRTPVDKRHPHLSAAATQPFVGLIFKRAKKRPSVLPCPPYMHVSLPLLWTIFTYRTDQCEPSMNGSWSWSQLR